MITVVHLITGLNVGGAEMSLARLVTRSDRAKFRHVVVSMMGVGPVGERIRQQGIPVHALGMRRGIPGPLAIRRLVALLRAERPDVLQSWMYHAGLLGTVANPFARARATAWNLRCSNMELTHYRRLSALTVWACAHLSRRPEVVVVNSDAGQKYHATLGYRPRKWALIDNGIDLAEFKPDENARVAVRRELGLAADALLIGFVARVDPMKDHPTFIKAAGELSKMSPDVHFVLVGEGASPENADLARLIDEAGVTSRVHLMGRRVDVARVEATFDIATSSAAFGEGFPNVIAEAMACGVPCVVTDVGDAARIVGDSGIVVQPRCPAGLAEGWATLIAEGADVRSRRGREARARVAEWFSLERAVRTYEDLYSSLLADQAHAA
jgi:glycosyltransferase involved in cell wall biosynthesis